MRTKVPGGRDRQMKKLAKYGDLRDMGADAVQGEMFVPQGSIACISGFLINIFEKTVMLSSPCYTTPLYRYGFRVFDRDTYEDAADLERVLLEMVERNMVESIYDEMPMAFRDDILHFPIEGGFKLVTPNLVQEFVGNTIFGPLGEMLAKGDQTYQQLTNALVDDHGFSPLTVAAIIDGLFSKGLLDEMTVRHTSPAGRLSPATIEQTGKPAEPQEVTVFEEFAGT